MKRTTFERIDMETWKAIATESLRGIPLENLMTETAESIPIKPLYTLEDLASISETEQMKMISSIRNGQDDGRWTVAQLQYAKTGKDFIKQLTTSLHHGNEAIVYNGNQQIKWETESLEKLATLSISYPIYATNIKEDDLFLRLFDLIPVEERANVTGAISGKSLNLPTSYKHIRTVCADLRELHHQGADSVTELAVALAQAADESVYFTDFTTFTKHFFTYFSIDTHFFMEIAKLRAFRLLWRTFSEAYGEKNPERIPIFSENSLRSYSKLDPHVNMLRAGNEALSATLGGTDVLTIHPYNVLTNVTNTARRTAQNTQLIIKYETLVNQVIDPAGGAYFIEQLTRELVEKAWNLFLNIESNGGYDTYVRSGALEKRLQTLRTYRTNQLKHRDQSLIGTNIYADLTTPMEATKTAVSIKNRLAEPYEQLRERFRHEQPTIVLLTFGDLANFKPRADFVSSYLAAGGLTCKWSPVFTSVDEAYTWLNENEFDYAVVCASVKEVEPIVDELIQHLPRSLTIDVAGNYRKERKDKWQQAGINGFIYKGQDQLAKLNEIKEKWEGGEK